MDRRGDRVDVAMGQDVYVIHAVRVQGRYRTPAGSPESDDSRPQPAAVLACHPHELQGMQNRAVTGHLVVLMKDVQPEGTTGRPVVHCLERDKREPPVDTQLGDLLVLDTMRPAPQHLPFPHPFEVRWLWLGQQDDIAFRDELRTGAKPCDAGRKTLVGYTETLTVAVLKVDAFPQISSDPLDMQRMDREPPFVLLQRPCHDSEADLIHTRPLARFPM
jgi:hypothetical protein